MFSTYKALDDIPHAGYESASKDDPEWFAKREAYRRQWANVPFEGGMHRAGLGAGPKSGDIVSGAIENWLPGYRRMTGTAEHDGKMRDDYNIGGGSPIRTILDSVRDLMSVPGIEPPLSDTKAVKLDSASIACHGQPFGRSRCAGNE